MTHVIHLVANAARASLWATALLLVLGFVLHHAGAPELAVALLGAYLAGFHAYLALLGVLAVILIGRGILALVL